jgi:hypothetical protein
MTLHVAPSLNRRHFLAGSAALGLAAGLSPVGFVDPAEARAIALRVARAGWDSLAGDLVGPLLRPKDSPFKRFAAPYNLAYNTPDRMPIAIAMCANTADVATAVQWAAKNKVPLVARAGGHSYAGFSMTSGLMIDVSTVRGNYWNKPDEITFGAGARNADLYKILSAAEPHRPHGRCPTVGAAGFLLGGGIGFNMRLHGVASDHLAVSEIVTADGKVLQLSENENADLFCTCRGGGGGNFGINTSFTLKIFRSQEDHLLQGFMVGRAQSHGQCRIPIDEIADRRGKRIRLALCADRAQPHRPEQAVRRQHHRAIPERRR